MNEEENIEERPEKGKKESSPEVNDPENNLLNQLPTIKHKLKTWKYITTPMSKRKTLRSIFWNS